MFGIFRMDWRGKPEVPFGETGGGLIKTMQLLRCFKTSQALNQPRALISVDIRLLQSRYNSILNYSLYYSLENQDSNLLPLGHLVRKVYYQPCFHGLQKKENWNVQCQHSHSIQVSDSCQIPDWTQSKIIYLIYKATTHLGRMGESNRWLRFQDKL